MMEASVKKLRGHFAALLESKAVRVGIMGVFALMFVTIFNTAAFAQNDVGTIVGEVTDPSGAVIPNATVTVVNEGTGESRTVLTDAAGRYTAANLVPTQYTITVTASGFEKFVSTHNTLKSNSTEEIDAKLTVGAASTSVQVSDTAQVLETQSGTVTSEVTGTQVQKLELNGRNPLYMAQFNPGVTGTTTLGDLNFGFNGGESFQVNGANTWFFEYWIDGSPANRTRADDQTIAGVNVDAVQEMQLLTADYSAEYGTGSAGELRVVTKSGTRDFHGGMYEYLRNTAMNANTWSRKEAALTASSPQPFRYNQFGFLVGGPVWIPKTDLLKGSRDKVFFFINEDYIRYRIFNTNTQTVPDNLMRMGNFSELLGNNPYNYGSNSNPFYLNDPASCYSSGAYVAANCKTYFSETGFNQIPGYNAPTTAAPGGSFTGSAALPNADQGMAFIAAYPTATPGFQLGSTNHETVAEEWQNQRKGQYNLDILMTPNQHLEFRRSDNSWSEGGLDNDTFGLVPLAWQRPNQLNSLGYEWTIKPTLIDEARLTVSDDEVYIPAQTTAIPAVDLGYASGLNNGYNRTAFGWDFNYIYPVSAEPKGTTGSPIPNKIPTMASVPTFTNISGTAYPSHSSGIIYALSDSLTYVWGNHTLKFGFYGNYEGENDNDQINVSTVPGGASNQAGTFFYSDNHNGLGNSTGMALANVMLGMSDSYNEIGAKAYTDWRGNALEEFAQDNWQVNPKLHLDYGVRFTTVLPPHALEGNSDFFDPNSYNAATAPTVTPSGQYAGLINTATSTNPFDGMVIPGLSQFPTNAAKHTFVANSATWTGQPAAVLDACEGEPCSNLFAPSLSKSYTQNEEELQPRFGLAYQLSPTSVFRAAAGRFAAHKMIIDNIFPGGNSPFQPTVTIQAQRDNTAGTGPDQQGENPAASVSSGNYVPPLTITTLNKKLQAPSQYNWNLSYEQEFTGIHSTLNVAYVGAVGNHNWQVVDINQPAAGTVAVNNAATYRPYQGYNTIQQEQGISNSHYKGLQVSWRSHFPDGSSVGVAYSGSTTMDSGSEYRDIQPDSYYNLNLWGPADFQIKSALILNYDYLLPFFKGRHDAAGQILGGWEVSGAVQGQTGEPLQVLYNKDYAEVLGVDGSMNGSAGEYWNILSKPSITKGFGGPSGTGPQWFNGCASGNVGNNGCTAGAVQFTAPTTGAFVTQSGVRNSITSNPGIEDWNISAVKTFAINESNAFEFHAEVYDLWNHANWNGANANPTSSQFGEITGKSGLARNIQVGLKYRF